MTEAVGNPLTRSGDHQARLAAEPGLEAAVSWLRTHTSLRRLGHMELEEALAAARAGGFVITLPEAH